jgi:hypothetical protein
MITTTGGFAIKETDTGLELVRNNKVVTAYRITKCQNGKWRIRLNGASYGFEIGYYYHEKTTYGSIYNECVSNFNTIIDIILTEEKI